MIAVSRQIHRVMRIVSAGTRRGPLTFAVVAILVASMGADQPKKEEAEKNAAQPIALFNGKNLDGWKKTEFGGEGEVSVKEGTIVMDVGSSMTGITSTRKDLPTTDYELSYEAKRLEGVDFFAAATLPVGKSHVTFVNGGWGGSVTGISSLDDLDASENETGTYHEYSDKTWYQFRIRITNERIQALTNDKLVINVSYKDRRVGTRIETDLNKPLGFATWETRGAVRNIRLRRLSEKEVGAINKSGEDE